MSSSLLMGNVIELSGGKELIITPAFRLGTKRQTKPGFSPDKSMMNSSGDTILEVMAEAALIVQI